MILLPKKGKPVLYDCNKKLLENWALISSTEASQENIGDELLRDENFSTDDNSNNVPLDHDKRSISSVEETSKMQNKKNKVCAFKDDFLLNPVPKQGLASKDIF